MQRGTLTHILTILSLGIITAITVSGVAMATPLANLATPYQNLPNYMHNVVYGLAGISTLGAGAMGLMGKMSWPWVASIVGSTALVGGAFDYIDYIVQ